MPSRKNTRRTPLTSRWMGLTLVPLYLFTLVLVLGPLVYMLVLSFETRADVWGVIPQFTWANYKNIFQPVYLNTFVQSLKLALLCTGLILLIGGVFKLQGAFDMRRMGVSTWARELIYVAVSVVMGLVIICNPFSTMMTLMRVIGAALVIEAVQDAICALKFYKIEKKF